MSLLEKHLVNQQMAVERWFREQWQLTPPLIYGSVDLRNAGFKLAPVDTNLFPAGFNNLDPTMMSVYVQSAQAAISELCPNLSQLLIIPESHTRNIYYFESLAMLKEILIGVGLEVCIGFLGATKSEQPVLPSGRTLRLDPLIRQGDRVGVEGFYPDCVLLNNDLSLGIPEILQNISQEIIPPLQLGWVTRLKSAHFGHYEQVVALFSQIVGLDPWLLMPYFDQCPEVDFMKREGQECLVHRAQGLLRLVKKKYKEYGIKENPFLVVKADQGTYGMAVLMIKEPQELVKLNRKQRTHMSTRKGGRVVTRAIIQEGVFSFETIGPENSVAEPVLYLMGRYVLGGFYRVHKNRGPDENLNTPGMDFEPLPFTKPCFPFYSYSVVARLAMLAAAREFAAFQGENR